MMDLDIYQFIESKDVRDYLKEMNYSFTAPEAAFLIWYSRIHVEEKIRAWEQVIAEMPDCEVMRPSFDLRIPDFHAFLRKLIDAEVTQRTDDSPDILLAMIGINLPMPFHKGDIVHPASDQDEERPFVLSGTSPRFVQMICVCQDGRIAPREEDQLRLEYCRKPLTGIHRALVPLSSYLKGKIDLELMMNACKTLTQISAAEGWAADIMADYYGHDDYDVVMKYVGLTDILSEKRRRELLEKRLKNRRVINVTVDFGDDDGNDDTDDDTNDCTDDGRDEDQDNP